MTSYQALNDPTNLHDERAFASAKLVAKFCSMGVVTSQKWFPCYVTIYDGILRLYDEEATAKANPANVVLQIPLDSKHRPSPWKRKDYSQTPGTKVDFYAFYVLGDNFGLNRVRELKLGSTEIGNLEKIIRCIEFNTQNQTAV